MKKISFLSRLPKFKSPSGNAFLILSLVIFSFALGMLTNKVLYLEQQLKNPSAQAAAPTDNQAALPTPPPVVKGITDGHFPVLGDKNAKVTVIEFADFQCPFCKAFFDDTESQLKSTYVNTGKVRFVYRQFPLTSIHPNAEKAAEAAECANEQGKFWEYHDVLYQNQDTWAPLSAADAANDFILYAGQVGMDSGQFTSCVQDAKVADNVNKDVTDGTNAQVDATPTFFVDGIRVEGAVPFSQMQQTIDSELKK